jgi:hypothetical protein
MSTVADSLRTSHRISSPAACLTRRGRHKSGRNKLTIERALNKEFDWEVNEGTEYDKVVNVFAFTTVRSCTPARS